MQAAPGSIVNTAHETSDREAEASARVGTSLRSKWHLDAILGIGGMATVYAATHRNGKRGAVKILHSSFGDADLRRRFSREGRIANRVQHDGVVSVLDDDVSEDDNPFLVMELLEGETISARAARTRDTLSTDVVLLLVDQVLDALAAAHDKGIIHRDIKPENIFITADERVKILDFGIARFADPLEAHCAVTQVGTAMGTPAFMAPEQARGRWDLVGPESDLWSVGATMFTLLTGDFVHRGTSVNELLAEIITQPVRSLAIAFPGAPTQLVAIVDRALQLERGARWHDARAMQTAVRAAYRAITGMDMPHAERPASSSAPPTALPRAPLATQRPLRRHALAASLVAVALGVSAFVTIRLSPAAPAATARTFDLSQLVVAPYSSTANVADSSAASTSPVATTRRVDTKVDVPIVKAPPNKLTSMMTTAAMPRTVTEPRAAARAATAIEGSVTRSEMDTKTLLDRRL